MQRTHRAILVPLAACGIAAPTAAQTDWVQIASPTQPTPRQNTASTFDVTRGVTVMFGAWDGSQRSNETWEWDGNDWVSVTTATSPPANDAAAMAFDAVRQVTVLTGGYVASNQTWEYDGIDWSQVTTTTTHPLGPHCPMVYDLGRGVCVLFGNGQTWEYDGTDWTQVATVSAPAFNGNMAYDFFRQVIVHFGDNGETWEYDGTAWTQALPVNAPIGSGCGSDHMVYDIVRQRVVLFSGCPGNGGDVWEYDGVDWTPMVTPNRPSSPRRYTTIAFDVVRGRTVFFGGRDFSGVSSVLVGDTWEYGAVGTLAANVSYGTGCGGMTLVGRTRPRLGTNWELEVGNLPTAATVGALLLGVTNPNVAFGPIAPGCTQYSGDIGFVLLLLPVPSPALSFAVPTTPNFLGVNMTAQGAALVPGANPLGVAATDGLRGTIGDI